MNGENNRLTGEELIKRVGHVLSITDLIGIPIVTLFLVYNISSGWEGFKANLKLFSVMLTVAGVIIGISIVLHHMWLAKDIKQTADFLDNPDQANGESMDLYRHRISGVLISTLRLPLKQSMVSLGTWPTTIAVVMAVIYAFFFKFPLGMMMLLVAGAICAGMLVAIFQFYLYKRSLEPALEIMLKKHPSYWDDPVLQQTTFGIKSKMMGSVIMLMFVMMFIIGILNYMDASKAVMFQWGRFQKNYMMAVMKDFSEYLVAAQTPEERQEIIKTLLWQSDAKIYLTDKDGNSLLPGVLDEDTKWIIHALTTYKYEIGRNVLLNPFAADKDIVFSTEPRDIAVSVRVKVVGTEYMIIARSSYRSHNQLLQRMAVMSICTVLAALFISAFFTKSAADDVNKPVKTILDVVRKVGRGELMDDINFVAQDELGALAINFKRMLENLRLMILQINKASGSVETATLRIVEGFKRVSEGSRSQSSAVDETSASMGEMNASIKGIGENVETLAATAGETSTSILEMSATIEEVADNVDSLNRSVEETTSSIGEMAASIKQVAENVENLSRKAEATVSSVTQMESSIKEVQAGAEETAQISELVAANAEGGAARVQSTIEGIGAARKSSQIAVNVIKELAEKANEIGNILTVIDDVTDETNLLALNAAIIAAQAGEHGRGFAVVADEIKDLAERTAQSTEEINQLIEAVQKGAREAVDSVMAGYKAVEQGVELSQQAGESLSKILESAQKSTLRAHDIAKATVEQADRTKDVLGFFEEISDSIRQLEIATREQSKGSSQIMKSSEEMREIAKHVKKATHEQFLGSKQIIQAVENINHIVSFINKSQSEQILNTDNVVQAIQDIRSIASQNEDGVEEMFQASANLSSLAEDLRSLVEAFKVTNDNSEKS